MLNNSYSFAGQFALSCLALMALGFVTYLIRLKLSDIRKRRIMAAKGVRFGLIQEITANGTSVGNTPAPATEQPSVLTVVPAPYKRAKRWTKPAGFTAAGFQWN